MILSSQPRRAFYSVLCICQAVIFEVFKVSLSTSTTCASINSALLVSGRRILQRYNRVSNSFFSPLPINPIDATSSLTSPIKPCKLLIRKAFSFPSAPEVGRIIERLNQASTPYLAAGEINPLEATLRRKESPDAHYIAQYPPIPHDVSIKTNDPDTTSQ